MTYIKKEGVRRLVQVGKYVIFIIKAVGWGGEANTMTVGLLWGGLGR